MLIAEILNWNDDPTERTRSDDQIDFTQAPFGTDLTNLANAFTRGGLVKHGWNLPGSEGQPSGPAPPDAETEVIPSGTLEPSMRSFQAEPIHNESPVGQYRLVPYRAVRQ